MPVLNKDTGQVTLSSATGFCNSFSLAGCLNNLCQFLEKGLESLRQLWGQNMSVCKSFMYLGI